MYLYGKYIFLSHTTLYYLHCKFVPSIIFFFSKIRFFIQTFLHLFNPFLWVVSKNLEIRVYLFCIYIQIKFAANRTTSGKVYYIYTIFYTPIPHRFEYQSSCQSFTITQMGIVVYLLVPGIQFLIQTFLSFFTPLWLEFGKIHS